MPIYLYPLADVLPDPAQVGGKAAHLARLTAAGLPVPPGFVITTAAYREWRLQREAVEAAIREAYAALGGGPVAMRSSATAEDLEEASFAGQQDTFLNIEGSEAVLEAVRACWASLHTERATAYRRSRGIPEETVAMAVIVQRMVPAEVAGVLFTCDPTDPEERRILVEAVPGLAEALVSGRVTPDRWTLDRVSGQVLSFEPATRPEDETKPLPTGQLANAPGRAPEAIVTLASPALEGRETLAGGERSATPGDANALMVPALEGRQSATRGGAGTLHAPSLSEADLQRLAALGRQVEQLFGAPQDIEWALASGELYLLQSRPITALASEREALRREEIGRLLRRAEPSGTVWARYSLAEVLPEPLPFTWALWRECMSARGGYGRMYRELGYDPDPALDDDGILDLIAGRPYVNLSRDARLYFRDYPFEYPFARLKEHPEQAIHPTPVVNLARAPKGFLLKLPGITRRMLAAERIQERAAKELPDRLEREVFPGIAAFATEWRARDLARHSERELLAAFAECRARVLDDFASQSLKPGVLAGLALLKLAAELKPALGEEARTTAEGLLAGVRPPEEYDLARGLEQLGSGRLSLAAFLDRFGHRGPGEMELALPRWRETPPVAGSIPGGRIPHLTGLPADSQVNRRKASLYLGRARRFTALRETAKHFLMLGYEVLRLLLLEIDRRFGLAGGVFYLEPAELNLLLEGEDLRGRIAVRRKRRTLALSLEAPRVLFSDDLEALGRPLALPGGSQEWWGTGVSPGSAEGQALVLLHPAEADPGREGFILVCPSTDPGWTPLFLRARGVVLETGGVLSHGAIVARELGLPAVANIPDACSRFRSGQRLHVDGTSGRVVILG